jgi:hypothetical protein
VLSGFFQEDAPLIIERANETGLKVVGKRIKDRWYSILLQH